MYTVELDSSITERAEGNNSACAYGWVLVHEKAVFQNPNLFKQNRL